MLSQEVFMSTMKADIKALGIIGSDAIEDGVAPSAASMSKYLWMYKPLDDESAVAFAKRYNMTTEDFIEYANKYKNFYRGK